MFDPFPKLTFQYVGPLGNIVSYIEPVSTLVEQSVKCLTPSRNVRSSMWGHRLYVYRTAGYLIFPRTETLCSSRWCNCLWSTGREVTSFCSFPKPLVPVGGVITCSCMSLQYILLVCGPSGPTSKMPSLAPMCKQY